METTNSQGNLNVFRLKDLYPLVTSCNSAKEHEFAKLVPIRRLRQGIWSVPGQTSASNSSKAQSLSVEEGRKGEGQLVPAQEDVSL